MSVRIDVAGDDEALEDLWAWLGAERELRGHLRWESPAAPAGTMGSGMEIAVQLSELGLTFVGTLVSSLSAWVSYRAVHGAEPTEGVTLTLPDGRKFELKHRDPEELARLTAVLSAHLQHGDDPAA
ncbi:effector-associated constant component EACC1 [Streptomyces xinghaiensis]|uniref:effector-associated constant component EACC1 n=1 Tax=Streptomyces xinghaiensis TaxID=1038928 RepID=UPI00341F3D64